MKSSKAFNITLPEELVKKVDKLAKQNYTSRSDVIRRALIQITINQPNSKFAVRTATNKQSSKPKLTLKQLLDGITPQNVHKEVDWGPPVGREIW